MPAARAAIVACMVACCLPVAHADEPEAAPRTELSPRAAASADPGQPGFSATAHVKPIEPPGEQVLSPPDLRTLRASFGDSFNPTDSLPGVVPVFSGVPYMLVRGAPPAGTAQYYDDMPVPSLFHLALGP